MFERHSPLLHRPLLWDAAIAILVIVPPLLAGWIIVSASPWIGWPLGVLLVAGAITVAYGSFLEPLRLTLNKKVIRISSLPSLAIAIAADMHIGPYRDVRDVRRLVKKINVLTPDLILLPGDFLFDHHSDISILDPLKDLRARYGVWACIGNHDSGDHATLRGKRYVTVDRSDEVAAYLRERGITVLRDEWRAVQGTMFAIAGVDGPWANRMDLAATFADLPADMPVILLAHNPDVALNDACQRASLIVSGHTHGGQIRLPFIGALHVPAETGKRYDHGIFSSSKNTTLAVTHGCGETLARARLLCPPEILLLELEKTAS